MDVFSNINSILNNPNAQNLIQSLAPKKAPKPKKEAAITVQAPPEPKQTPWLLIGSAAAALGLALILILRKK